MPPPPAHAFVRVDLRDGQAHMTGQASWESAPEPADPAIGGLRGAWIWDGAQLRASVDRFGFYNLYCYEKDGVVALSSSMLELVAQGCDATLDARALAVCQRMGIFIHDETPLKYVRTLPPEGRLLWADGRLSITGGAVLPRQATLSRDSAIEGMITYFRSAMTRILSNCDDAPILPLTGGRDSRHILLEMLHQGRPPQACVTFHHNGAQMNAEARSARLLAERAGVHHDVLGYARPRLTDTLRTLILTSLCADEHAQMMPLHDYLIGRDVACFDGVAGDILTNPDNDAEAFFRLAETDDFTAIARALCAGHARVISQPGRRHAAEAIFRPEDDAEVQERIGQAIAEYADAPDPYQMFWFYHRTRREINFVSQAIMSPARISYCLYLDEAFARFCLALPYEVTRDQQLHNVAIARAYPAYADIPYQDALAPTARCRGGVAHWQRSLTERLRLTRRLQDLGCPVRIWDVLLPPEHLNVQSDMVYRLHGLCLTGLDAARARALLDLGAELQAARPRAVVSDTIGAVTTDGTR